MKNKILFDCERLKYPNTGLFTFCESLGNALLRNVGKDQSITFYTPPQHIGIFGKKVDYIVQRSWHKLFIPGSKNFQIWHASNQVSRYFPYSKSVKIVLTIHDLNFLIEKKHSPYKIQKLIRQIQKKIDRAASIVCISNFVLDQVKQYFDLNDKKISVIYNGCTVREYPDNNSTALSFKPFLFSIGTILPKKNFHVLPALLVENDYELIIAGNLSSPEYIQKITAEAKRLNVLSRLKIIGPISDQDKYWYYKNCEAFVFPSIAEGFGLPVIEAMHYGKPVFLSKHTSLPEIGADAAYYFETFEQSHMQKTLKDGLKDYSQGIMSHRAKMRASQFNWNNTAKAYLELYQTLI